MPETNLERWERVAAEYDALFSELSTDSERFSVHPDNHAVDGFRVRLEFLHGNNESLGADDARALAKAILKIVGEEEETCA